MVNKGYYKHNKTGKKIYIDCTINHLDYKTMEEYNECHCHITKGEYNGYWKYIKESVILKNYTACEWND
jgi:hypothetical protein